jgi:ATP-dependent Zn protease
LSGDQKTLELVVSMTSGMSQAGLNRLVEEAGAALWRRGVGTLRSEDLLDALSTMTIGESEGVPYNPAQKLRIAVHEAGHGCYSWLSQRPTRVGLLSLRKRGSALGLTASYGVDDSYVQTTSELMGELSALISGSVAEEIFLGETSTGAQSDLLRATALATSMVVSFGMRGSLMSVDQMSSAELKAFLIGTSEERVKVEEILQEARLKAHDLLWEHSEQVWSVVLRLVEEEEMTETDLIELLGMPREAAIAVDCEAGVRVGDPEIPL